MNKSLLSFCLALGLLLIGLDASHAQATRTWVSGVGDDANPCSRTAPCKTFAGAISKTAVNGEISVLDPGGFGALTITKSISIVADGSEGSILACFTNGIIINAGATAVVQISGIYIEGCRNGTDGIRILSAKSVHIRKTVIRGFAGGAATGIKIQPSAGDVNVVVSDSSISDNRHGIVAQALASSTVNAMLDRVVVANNLASGIRSLGGDNTVTLSNSVVSGNNTGLESTGGAIVSLGNNVIRNNNTNGSPTNSVPLQ